VRLLRTGGPLKENGRVRAKLVDHLATRSTRRASDTVVVGDCNCLNFNLWAQLRDSGKDRGSFGAVSHSVGCILDIAARKHFPVREQDRGAHMKIRVRGMRILHHFDRRLLEPFPHVSGEYLLGHRD